MKERSPREKQRWMLASVLALGAGLAATVWFASSSGRQAAAQQPQIQVQVFPGGARGMVQIGGRRFPGSGQDDGDDAVDGVFLPADRDTTRQWERAKSLLEGGHYTDAITLLDEILQNGEDFFFRPQAEDKSEQSTGDRETKSGAPARDPKLPIRMNSDVPTLPQGAPKPANNQPQDAVKASAPPAKTNKEAYRSLKWEAQRLIGEMPEAGREAYELQFGARAQQMLNEAAAAGDISELEAVTRRYFHTNAGFQATMLLGRHHLDHDQPLAAAFCFQRLLDTPAAASKLDPMLSILLAVSWQRAGMPERAEETLTALKKKDPNAKLRIADKLVRLFADEKQSLTWLESTVGKPTKAAPGAQQQWTLVRGDAARNATSVGGMPLLTPLWRVSTTNHPTLEKTLGTIRQQYLDQGIAAQPAMQPLAVENLVLMRTARDLLAVDFATGKRLWPVRTTSDTSLEQLLSSSPGANGSFDAQRNPALIERFWEDATFGTLSSDGERVYMIDGLDASMTPADMQQGQMIPGRMFMPGRMDGRAGGVKRFNELTAHELRTQGKLKWVVGGASGGDEPQLAGAFFLGPPLPLEGKLYVLAETKASEIKLCVLDAKTGKLDWSQQLAMVEQGIQNIQQDPLRRFAGCSPSYADGVVLCPTTAGAIVAVDIANRTLRWGYQYQRDGSNMSSNVMIMRGGGGWQQWNNGIPQMSPAERWMDSSITIAGNYAIVTPLESNELHCVNLVDGKLLWKLPRGENLYVGGVHDGTLVLVGKHQVSLVKLGTEKPTTNKVIDLPSGIMPSGRGFLSSDSYFLPLTSAEVAQIDLTTGKIAARSKSRSGTIPGNLICYQGEVVSQGIDYVETFFQREPLEERIAATLKEKPKDGWALAHRGELELEDGKLDAALTDLRQAYSQDADPGNRELLFEALLTGLSQDFKAHRDALPDLQKLVEDDHEKGILLRVTAAGLQQAGDVDGAMQALLKLAALELPAQELEDLEPKLSVLRARWVRSQFQNLWSNAKKDDRKKIDAALEKDLEQAIAAQSTKGLRQFVTCFGDHPVADRARMALATELSGPETLLEREQLLLELENSPEASTRGAAALKLASVLQDAGQTEATLAIYRKLEADFGDKPVQNGKSAKELLAALPEGSMLRRAAEQDRHWPKGEVKVEQTENTSNNSRPGNAGNLSRVFGTELEGQRGQFFTGVLLGRDLGRQEIVGVNGVGKQLFQIPLGGDATRSLGMRGVNVFGNNVATGDFAMVQGHILIVCTGYQIMALDTLKPVAVAGNSLLWMKDLGDFSPMMGNVPPLPRQNMPWGGMRRIQGQQTIFGDVALCGDRTLCFQHGRDITAIDPLTGQTQWVRHGVEIGCDLFGDDEMVIVAPPSGRPALVFRTTDGQLLGERNVPPIEKRWTNYGHRMLVFHDQTNPSLATLALFDPWTQQDVWSETFSGWNNGQNPALKGVLVNGEAVALMQTDGKFVLLNLADGHKIIDTELKEEKDEHGLLQNIQVIASSDQYFLLTNRQPQPGVVNPPMHGMGDVRNAISNSQPVVTMNAEQISQIMSGHVYAFERSTGKPQWSGPAAIDQHGYLSGQPIELPVLTFVRNVNSFSATRNAQSTRGSVLCLDKRTGRAVYSDDDIQPLNGFEITGNPDEKTVTLAFAGLPNQQTSPPVTLKFTDKPVADAAPYQAGEAEKETPATDSKDKE